MTARISIQSVLTESDVASGDNWTVVSANVEFVNALMGHRVFIDSMQPETVMSYYVDFYLAQVNNGGHEQLVRNSYVGRWVPWHKDGETLDPIAAGLREMGA